MFIVSIVYFLFRILGIKTKKYSCQCATIIKKNVTNVDCLQDAERNLRFVACPGMASTFQTKKCIEAVTMM